MDISVIIVSYQARCFLEQCLRSVERACHGHNVEVWVIDNHSSDGTREYLATDFPFVQFRWLNSNLGFAKANNIALKEAKGQYVLFLNPDVVLPEDFFKHCLDWFLSHPSCGALGVRMIDGSGSFLKESKRGMPTPWRSLCKMSGLSALFPSSRRFAGYYAGHLSDKESAEVEVLAGACMMLTRAAADATGGFDERFFMYAEDIDLSCRVRQSGFQTAYLASTTIIHFKGESTRKLTVNYIRQFYGAMRLFVQKQYAGRAALRISMQWLVAVTGMLATAGMFLQKMSLRAQGLLKGKRRAMKTVIVASQQGFNEVLKIAAHSPLPMLISGRVSAEPNDLAYAMGTMEDISAITAGQGVEAVVFCLDDMPASRAIRIMQEVRGSCRFYFHYRGTRSLVGSHDRDSRGDQVSLLSYKPDSH